MISVNDHYTKEIECDYRDEHYSVRDNGAIMRHKRLYCRQRKLDNVWTFGNVSQDGYLLINSEAVHRIVATAFHGPSPAEDYIVDHIDTNRQNNRPENLRWLTRLENILNNPITLSKIVHLCGSIEAFLENPGILSKEGADYRWMRAVTPEEAKNALNNLMKYANLKSVANGGKYSDWASHRVKRRILYVTQQNDLWEPSFKSRKAAEKKYGHNFIRHIEHFERHTLEYNNRFSQACNANAQQRYWGSQCDFLLCPEPSTSNSIEEYYKVLEIGKVFLKREYGDCRIADFLYNEAIEVLFVACIVTFEYEGKEGQFWNIITIAYRSTFLHERHNYYLDEKSLNKAMKIASKFTPDSWIFRNQLTHAGDK